MNPQNYQLPNIEQIKRSIQYQNYKFNQKQIQQKNSTLHKLKAKDRFQSSILNQKAYYQLQDQKQREIKRKQRVQNVLQSQYDQQINYQRRIKTEQKSVDKIYSQMQKQMLLKYEASRIIDLGKIYHIENSRINKRSKYGQKQKASYTGSKRVMTEQVYGDSLDNLKQKSLASNLDEQFRKRQIQRVDFRNDQKFQKETYRNRKQQNFKKEMMMSKEQNTHAIRMQQSHRQIQKEKSKEMITKTQNRQQIDQSLNKHQMRRNSNSQMQKPSYSSIAQDLNQIQSINVNIPQKKHSTINLEYSDYLKQEIQRKNQIKFIQKQKQMEKDRQFIDKQNKSYYDLLQQMKHKKQKLKWQYSLGLQKQIKYKKQNPSMIPLNNRAHKNFGIFGTE